MTPDRHTRWMLLLGLMVLSLASLRSIPFMQFGADFRNIYAFEQCARDVSPYALTGSDCGDPWNRNFVYPPLLFQAFRWARWLSLEAALRTWAVVQFVLFAGVLACWVHLQRPRREFRVEAVLFSGLLLFEYPLSFLIERGGSDAWAVLLATLGAWFLRREQALLAGAAFGVATAYKIYPGIAALVLGLALFCAAPDKRPRLSASWFGFALGVALSFAAACLLSFRDSELYFTQVLPKISHNASGACEYSHSLVGSAGDYPNLGRLLFAGVAATWIYAGARALKRGDALAAVAGALAISTYLQGTSWDYNLVTTYPLLVLLFVRGQRHGRWRALWVGLVAVIGERAFYTKLAQPDSLVLLHLALEVLFLILAALELAGRDRWLRFARAAESV